MNGDGLRIASQIRYLQYFEYFLKSNFNPPYSQIVAPHAIDPMCFDFLMEANCRLKVTSICLGPFDANPSGLKLKVKMIIW